MKLHEIIFAAGCGVICAGALWCAANLNEEPFYLCISVFTAAFWGSLSAFVVWARICENERQENEYRPSIIWPHGRRPQ